MSLYDYQESQIISVQDRPFYALIMAAFRQADTDNLGKLRCAFPATWREYITRYNAPGGLLEGEQFDKPQEYPDVPEAHPLEKYFGPPDGHWWEEEQEVKVVSEEEQKEINSALAEEYEIMEELDGTQDTGD